MASRKEKTNYYALLSRRLRSKKLREYNVLNRTRKPRPIVFSFVLVSVALLFVYYKVTTEVQVVRSHDILTPLEPTEGNSTGKEEHSNKENLDNIQLSLINFNNMTYILNLTQDIYSVLENVSKHNYSLPLVIQKMDKKNFAKIPEVANNYIKNKVKKRRRKPTLALNHVNFTESPNSKNIRKVRYKTIDI